MRYYREHLVIGYEMQSRECLPFGFRKRFQRFSEITVLICILRFAFMDLLAKV